MQEQIEKPGLSLALLEMNLQAPRLPIQGHGGREFPSHSMGPALHQQAPSCLFSFSQTPSCLLSSSSPSCL